jgi:hypothetical protein
MTPHETAAALSEAGKALMLSAWRCDDGGYRVSFNKFYPPTISALERRGLLQFGCLTPFGQQVRNILEADNG